MVGFYSFYSRKTSKVANLDQKTCKKKTMKGKLGKDSITSSLCKISKCKLSTVRQFKPCNNSRPRSWLFCFKDSKVVYFKWNMFGFASEIVFNLFFCSQENSVLQSFARLPWLNTEAVVCRYSSKWVQNRCS